jgi:hypothetical protein
MHPFLQHFESRYKQKLGKRFPTFFKTFEHLLSLKKAFYTIVETGTARRADAYDAEGMSTLLFDEFLNFEGIDGNLISIDIDPNNVSFSASKTSSKTQVVCGNSIQVLYELVSSLDEGLDLLYLDAMDLDWGSPHPSSLHHLKEFCSALPLLREKTIIVVDDNERGIGKGSYIHSYMNDIQQQPFFNEYQIGWVWQSNKP